jgi:thiol-disulfide isomerase/thioredoxin
MGSEQLCFTGETLEGKDFSGQSLKGKAVVLWFWAPWCPKCKREAPTVARAAQANLGKVEFIGAAAQDQLPAGCCRTSIGSAVCYSLWSLYR